MPSQPTCETTLSELATPLAQALGRMLMMPPDRRPFVIVEDIVTERFVQFAGSASEPIVVDLPKAPEGGNQFVDEAVVQVFLPDRTDLGDGVIDFNKRVKTVIDATSLASALFASVHKLPPEAKLVLSEGQAF